MNTIQSSILAIFLKFDIFFKVYLTKKPYWLNSHRVQMAWLPKFFSLNLDYKLKGKRGRYLDLKNNILDTHHKYREGKNTPTEIRRPKPRRKLKELTSYIFLELLLQTLVWDFLDLE